MDAGFFRKRVSSNVINLERNDTTTTISKPTTGGSIKRGQTKGFTIENINDKMKLMNKHAPKGNWRRFKKRRNNIHNTDPKMENRIFEQNI